MNAPRLISTGSALTAATFLALWVTEIGHRQEPDTDRLYARIASRAAGRELRQAARIAALTEELQVAKALVNETSLQLTDANQAIMNFREAMPRTDPLQLAKALKLAGPGPEGRFQRLISRDGTVLHEGVEFSSESGGRLTFKTPKGRRAFDATDLHPAIIGSLGFDLNGLQANARQSAIERTARRVELEKAMALAAAENRRQMEEKAREDFLLRQKRIQADKELQEQRMQYDLAQQQLRTQQQRDRANEQLRLQQMQLERIRLDNEAYQLYLIQQQQLRTRTITVPQPQSVGGRQNQSYSSL